MRIQIASDLHREFLSATQRNPEHKNYCPLIEVDPTVDALILAGDIDTGTKSIDWMASLGVPVVYIAGNHEFYGYDINVTKKIAKEAYTKSIHFLDPGTVHIKDSAIIGGTLWTDFNLNADSANAMQVAPHWMNDYRQCYGMTPEWVLSEFKRHYEHISSQLDEGQGIAKRVVVTHHLPSKQAVHPKWNTSHSLGSNAYYASDLDALLRDTKPDLWIHGHTHESLDHEIEGVRVICNPYGYHGYEVNPDFNPRLIVEI